MTKPVLLSNVEHRDLRVITRRGAAYGDDVMAAMTFPAEFRNVQAHYPIAFSKSAEGTYTPVALFGFRDKQNLFLTEQGWDAHYVPLMVARQPFYIGQSPNGKVLQIDLDSPRLSRTEGEALFKEHGGNTEFLERMGGMLSTIDQGVVATQPFVAALQEHNLLESFVVDIELRVAMGYLAPTADASSGGLPIVDGAFIGNATNLAATFPYLNTPYGGAP